MINHALSFAYAKALFDLDCMDNTLNKRVYDFEALAEILEAKPKFVKFLKAPFITLKEKKQLLSHAFNDKFDKRLMNFLSFLLEKGRFANLKGIAYQYKVMVNKYLQIWEADLVTAVPIGSSTENRLKEKLERKFQKQVILNKKVDPKMIGGAFLVMPNEMLDFSVRGRLKKLKEKLIATEI